MDVIRTGTPTFLSAAAPAHTAPIVSAFNPSFPDSAPAPDPDPAPTPAPDPAPTPAPSPPSTSCPVNVWEQCHVQTVTASVLPVSPPW